MISRRQFLKLGMGTAASAVLLQSQTDPLAASSEEATNTYHFPFVRNHAQPSTDRPNVLFIGIDDLNDWIGCLGGHPNAKTPHIDSLAQRGVLFERAYCAYPMCNASRASLMTGIAPSTSGIYTNVINFRDSPVLSGAASLPQYFKIHGYRVTGAGKMYCSYPDPASWEDYWPAMEIQYPPPPRPPDELFPLNGLDSAGPFFDWGPLDIPNETMDDWQVATKISELLNEDHDRPFFIACGFFSPHQPFYAPREYFKRHRLQDISLPATPLEDDLRDVPYTGRKLALGNGEHDAVVRHDQWKHAVRAYLACVSFVDDCVGRVISALNNSPYRDNTIIVLWSDHGWHLGEKRHWKKHTLWEDSTRNVLMFAGPGVETPGWRVNTPVSLMDIYPTLVELSGLEPNYALEGHSLYPMFGYPQGNWPYPALTSVTSNKHIEINFAVRKDHWRYIRYDDGTEELYDHRSDPNEWNNIAKAAGSKLVMQRLAQWVPENPMPAILPVAPTSLSNEEQYALLND